MKVLLVVAIFVNCWTRELKVTVVMGVRVLGGPTPTDKEERDKQQLYEVPRT
jgi:hypothetical protein